MSNRWDVSESFMEIVTSGERWLEEEIPGAGGLFNQFFAADVSRASADRIHMDVRTARHLSSSLTLEDDDRAVLDEAERRAREYARRIEDMRLYSPVPMPAPLPSYPGCQPPRFTPRRKSYKTKRGKR